MDLRTVLLIVLSAVAALTIVFYQYFYKDRKKGSLKVLLAALRFVALFSFFLLLVNPQFITNDYFLEKPNLVVLVDDSNSMKEAAQNGIVADIIDQIRTNTDLLDRFSVHQYAFGEKLEDTDSLWYEEKNTDITNALSAVDEIFVNNSSAVVLLTDGNQTLGKDYQYFSPSKNLAVYPVVVGDTTKYQDLSVGFLNTNRYAFLKNKFPVEANIHYSGRVPVSKTVTVTLDGTTVYRERINLTVSNNSHTLSTLLDAKDVGIKSVKVQVEALENEKNPFNNVKETAVEVIDEKTNVVIISDILHPDIGALKKAIESNEQRVVTVAKPNLLPQDLEQADILLLYQPNRSFRNVYEHIAKSGVGHFTIAGTKTDWNFLNQAQEGYTFQNTGQTEDILPVRNNTFGLFSLDDFEVDRYPPLKGNLGDLEFKEDVQFVLFQKIRGLELDIPLFTVLTPEKQRQAILFGENIWRWRAQTFRNDGNFQRFDNFIGKLMLYLSNNSKRSRLDIDYAPIFDNAQSANISAQYFDESYVFDPNATLTMNIQGLDNGFVRESPLVLKGNFYEVDLSDLEAGEYNFTIVVEKENLKRSGRFKILDFNPEKQQFSADYGKLEQLAQRTQGKIYLPKDVGTMIADLSTVDQYRPIQKSRQNVVSLIDFRILLGLIAMALATEWFIRKYNGLI
ncbi:vWA domain-containing protein [Flagellimonas meishanensis]|uniref:vWA domain-containing protein n=1 Tax=Flagellimonas meishanensis TaxID=2873264 RepID=UPI001CA76727|nr:vWA domain-containing protein [[Muricauda] meishanensis]